MTRVYPILLLVLLTGCAGQSTLPDPSVNVPVPPALTQSLASPCPPLSQLSDNSIGELATEDANAAVEYAKCQEKHAEVVSLYDQMRNEAIQFRNALAAQLKELSK